MICGNYRSYKAHLTILPEGFDMRLAFEARESWDIVNGTERCPTLETKVDDWKKKDAICRSMISRALTDQHKTHVMNCTEASEMWNALARIFKKTGDEEKGRLLQKFLGLSLQKGMSIIEYISKLEYVYFQIKAIDSTNTTVSEELLMSKILQSLPERLNYFRTSWRMQGKETKTLINLKAQLMEEENSDKKSKEEAVAFYSKSNKFCTKCKRPGHETSTEKKLVLNLRKHVSLKSFLISTRC